MLPIYMFLKIKR